MAKIELGNEIDGGLLRVKTSDENFVGGTQNFIQLAQASDANTSADGQALPAGQEAAPEGGASCWSGSCPRGEAPPAGQEAAPEGEAPPAGQEAAPEGGASAGQEAAPEGEAPPAGQEAAPEGEAPPAGRKQPEGEAPPAGQEAAPEGEAPPAGQEAAPEGEAPPKLVRKQRLKERRLLLVRKLRRRRGALDADGNPIARRAQEGDGQLLDADGNPLPTRLVRLG